MHVCVCVCGKEGGPTYYALSLAVLVQYVQKGGCISYRATAADEVSSYVNFI